MNRQNWKRLLTGCVVAAVLFCAAPRADAHCHGCGWGGYGWGGWGGYWGGTYSGWWPGCGGCYNCGWSSYYPPYFNSYGCGGCAGWASGEGYSQGFVVADNSTSPASTTPASNVAASETQSTVSTDNSGTLTVSVPADAKVTINGRETRSTGSQRQYVSNGLTPGMSYTYVVKAEVVRNGQVAADTKTVTLAAGQANSIAFALDANPKQVVANP